LTPRAAIDGDLHQELVLSNTTGALPAQAPELALPRQKRLGLRGLLLRPVFRLEVGLRGRGLARGRLGGRRGRLARLGAHHTARAPFGCPARGAGARRGPGFFLSVVGAAGRPSKVPGGCRRASADLRERLYWSLVAGGQRRGVRSDGPGLRLVSGGSLGLGRAAPEASLSWLLWGVLWMDVRMGTRRVVGRRTMGRVRCSS
jgi:hypothetical protein